MIPKAAPMDPTISVKIIAYLRLSLLSKGPTRNAPKAAPIGSNAI